MLQLEKIFQNHMMLQRNCENKIYGKDLPGESIEILFQDQCYDTIAGVDGNWSISITPTLVGGPYSMLLSGSSQLELKDILIGDLYFLSGQSNMEMKVTETIDVTNLESLAELPQVRFLSVVPRFLFQETKDSLPDLTWKCTVKENFSDMSAIGYFFAKEILESQKIPVGLIQTAVGGSCIEAWMKKETLESMGNKCQEIQEFYSSGSLEQRILEQVKHRELWSKSLREDCLPDKEEWEEWYLPQILEPDYQKPFYGNVWLKREFNLDETPSADGLLRMGLMIDEATIWINNHYVGRGLHRYEMLQFQVCKDILKQGTNEILIRLVIGNGIGGLVPQTPYRLTLGSFELDLSGIWKLWKGKRQQEKAPDVLFPPLLPLGLFYGVLGPLRNLSFRSVLWYQGESNVGHPEDYQTLFYRMKEDWEGEFLRPLSFCCVQLANYQDPLNKVKDTGWAKIRNDQVRCRNELSKVDPVGVVTAIDLGSTTNLHPHNKKEVAHRMALWVQNKIYHQEIGCHGPVFSHYKRMEDKVCLYFDYDDSVQETVDHFEIMTALVPWKTVKAKHQPGIVEIPLSHIAQKEKIQLRYAWNDDPGVLDFYNSQGLPAESFFLEIE